MVQLPEFCYTRNVSVLLPQFVRSRERRGTSLVELMVSMGVLAVVLATLFVLFAQSYNGFHLLNTRQSVQGEVLQVRNWLENDFSTSHLGSVGVVARPTTAAGQPVSRDGVCCLTVSDWAQAANYFPSGTPKWNRFIVYYASLDEAAELRRLTVLPQDLSDGTIEFLTVKPFPMPTDLEGWTSPEILERRTISHNVLDFACELDLGGEALTQRIKFRRQGAHAGLGAKKVDEAFEATFHWTPVNTVPRL